MVRMEDHWVMNSGIRLHYYDSKEQGEVPILFIPGVSESAEDYSDVIKALSGIRCIAITFRGRGRSGSPMQGYSLTHHVSDIETVVDDANLTRLCLVGVSRGVSYAAAFAIKHPERVAGLIVCDYPIRHTRLPDGWADWFWTTSWRGKPVSQRMSREAVVGLQRESADVALLDDLARVECQVLIIRGGQKGIGLPGDEAEKAKSKINGAEMVVFEGSGHDLRSPDPERFTNVVRQIHTRLDQLNHDLNPSAKK